MNRVYIVSLTVAILVALSSAIYAQTPADSVKAAREKADAERIKADWANLGFYRDANKKLAPPAAGESRVVFYGNSITFLWEKVRPDFFKGKPYVDRGISGQTTPQMLVRFRQDVVNLKPKAVVILAGTNDIAGNTGLSSLEMIMDNIASMAEVAQANHISVVLCSVLPAYEYKWRPGIEPAEKIAALNTMIRKYAEDHHLVYVDYYSSMVDERKGLRSDLCFDGVHPNEAGFKIMEPIIEATLAKVLGRQ